MSLKHFLQGKALYWSVTDAFNRKVSFNYFKKIHEFRQGSAEGWGSLKIFVNSLLKVFLYSGLAALFIYGVDWIVRFRPFSYLPNLPTTLSDDRLGLLISTVVTVGGVFLGLYFAAVSTVAGGLFLRAPRNLQRLFLREKKGSQYIKLLAFTTLVGVFYLLQRVFDYHMSQLGPVMMTALAAYAIIRFTVLGIQAFYFINPIEACATVTGDAARAIDRSTVGGHGWNKDYLQNHHRKIADGSIKTLSSLVEFGIEAFHLSGEQLLDVSRYVAGLLDYYSRRKVKIPTTSLWFRDRSQYQNWLFADADHIGIALSTGTQLQPKSFKEQTWFEAECIDLLLKLFDHFSEKKQWAEAQASIEILVTFLEKVGRNIEQVTAKLVFEKIGEILPRSISRMIEDKTVEASAIAAIFDSFGRIPLGALLGYFKYVDQSSGDLVEKQIQSVDWLSQESIYLSELPIGLVPSMETTATRLANEVRIEGRILSPDWYILTITSQEYLFVLKRYFEFIRTTPVDLYRKSAEDCFAREQYVLAAHFVQRWIEFSNKLSACLWSFDKLVKDCAKHKHVVDLPWVEIDFEAERKMVEQIDKEAVDFLAKLLPKLPLPSSSGGSDLPDHFGQAYFFAMQAGYQACIENDDERFRKIFPVLFQASLNAYDAARKQTDGWTQDSQIIFSSEPLEDLLTLCGYAKIYSELFNNEKLWRICEHAWDIYLKSVDAKEMIRLLFALFSYRDSKFVIMPRATFRTHWGMRLHQKMLEMKLTTDLSATPRYSPKCINHPSPLIRVIGSRGDLMSPEPRQIFIVTFLAKHPAASDLDAPDKRELGEDLIRAEQQGYGEEENTEDEN